LGCRLGKALKVGYQPTTVSPKGIELIKQHEGLKLCAYPDPGTGGDPWTIGYGHTGSDVIRGMEITEEEAELLLKEDLAYFENQVSSLITVMLTQEEFDAIVSFTYNVGAGNLKSSTFRRRINSGEDKATCFKEEFPKWVKGGNGPMPGLVKRRQSEIAQATLTPFLVED
tara:strand:+ start:233 stop:742 length:510 start_codon:yes stop_codon:yes gene_type:complete